MAKEWHGVRGGRQQKTWILSFIIALSLESFAGIYPVKTLTFTVRIRLPNF